MKRLVFSILLTLSWLVHAASPDVEQARELLDGYYGDRARLERAKDLLQKAVQAEPRSADVYVQAARLSVMSGHVIGHSFRGNTVEIYHALLDKALALDPTHAKAHVLKAEAHDIQDRLEAEKASLDRARELNPTDPWVWIGYARYHTRMGQEAPATEALSKVIAGGPGQTTSDRKAYITALEKAAFGLHLWRRSGDVMQYASVIRRERDPADAWVMGNMATLLNLYGRYGEAAEFARDARRTMDYGRARVALSVALYGKAAELIVSGRPLEARPLVAEAAELGVPRERILSGYALEGPAIEKLRPTLAQIVQ